jgi:hypothetical protein
MTILSHKEKNNKNNKKTINEKTKHNCFSDVVKKLLSYCSPMLCGRHFGPFYPHLSGGTMASSETCCHLPGKILNSAAEWADRARINRDGLVGRLQYPPTTSAATGIVAEDSELARLGIICPAFFFFVFFGGKNCLACLETSEPN